MRLTEMKTAAHTEKGVEPSPLEEIFLSIVDPGKTGMEFELKDLMVKRHGIIEKDLIERMRKRFSEKGFELFFHRDERRNCWKFLVRRK